MVIEPNKMPIPAGINVKELYKKRIDALKDIFGGEIKQSFLISILAKVHNNHPDILKYYDSIFNFNLKKYIEGENDDSDYDICRHIIGIHNFHMLGKDDSEKGSLQRDSNYISKLCDEVYENISLRLLGSSVFRNKEIFTGDRFLFFPIGYDIFISTTYLYYLAGSEKLIKEDINGFLISMVNEMISALTLIENGLLIQAYPQARNLVELYFKYAILFNIPDYIKAYYKFCEYEIEYLQTKKLPEEFEKRYEEKKCKCKKIDYLHYGWIDDISDFDALGKGKAYSFTGLYNYLKFYTKNPIVDELKKMHDACHTFSHGSTISKIYPLETFFEIMPLFYYITRGILIDISNLANDEPVFNEVNLVNKLENDWKEFVEKKSIMNMVKIKQYYDNKS